MTACLALDFLARLWLSFFAITVTSDSSERAFWEQLMAKLRLRRCTAVGEGVRVFGRVDVVDRGVRRLGNRVTLDASVCPIELKAEPAGEIILGDDVYVEGGVSIWAYARIAIGSRVRLGAYCQLVDNHFHMPGEDRFMFPKSKPVTVEDDVIIGAHAILLPGAHIGEGSIVHPRTVITRRMPPFSEIRGVPATITPRAKAAMPSC
jgi:acetyltransferase-like isoleucine patch superfamily enzyme